MNIILVGLNHKIAPIEIREHFYLNEAQTDLFLSELKSNPEVLGACIISTCNRTEIYLHVLEKTTDHTQFIRLLCNIKDILFEEALLNHFYLFKRDEAIRHLLEVATGLDSLVIGEKQIIGQTRNAFERARERGILSKNFNVLANAVIRAGKKARAETNIGIGGSSVSWAAITKAEKELNGLKDKSVLMIGAGEMSKLAVGQVFNKGFDKLYLMNRTPEHAQKLANQFDGECVAFCDIKETLSSVDLCICSSSAPHYILDKGTVEKAMVLRDNRPLLFIDISMPRNLDPQIKEIPGVKLYHIDELNFVVEKNMRIRKEAITDVEKIIEEKLFSLHNKFEKIKFLNSGNLSTNIVESM